MIQIPASLITRIEAMALDAEPNEVCGFLVGVFAANGAAEVNRLVQSPNIAADPGHRFEIDPVIHFGLQRRLRESGEQIVGTYHSHPRGPAQPSPTDCAEAFEPNWFWLITTPGDGDQMSTSAFRMLFPEGGGQATGFEQVDIRLVQG